MEKLTLYNRIIFMLAIVGFLVAGYVLKGYLAKTSVYCPAGGGCDVVRNSPYAWPLGVPVPAFGFLGYTIILVLSFLRTVKPKNDKVLLDGILGMAIFGTLFVTGFSIVEAFLIKRFCFWCVVSSVTMYTIFGLTIWSLIRRNRSASIK
ncbi:MAG: vitamin K epoxide reductase family protein [Deltaproteobacteria bacterium]|nr:vitamin K epoxide reductase family protein [Deltaproteobacteria bacterium]